jgi:hypothetical protein
MKLVTYHTTEEYSNFIDMIPPTDVSWNWVKNTPNGDVHIFEDTLLINHLQYNGKIKIAFLLECPDIFNYCSTCDPSIFNPHEWIKQNHQYFNYIMSPYNYIENLVGSRYIWTPPCGSRILLEDFGIYEKERLISIVASNKTWTTGHKLRHEIIKRYPGKIDTYGSGYNNIIDNYNGTRMGKIIAVAPYYYSFAIMNSIHDDFFTEVLTDVLATGTIPIWWGTKNISKYFNMDGIISFNTVEELDLIIPTLTPELYASKTNAILENIEKAKLYSSRFEWIYKNLKPKFESL